MNKDPFEELFGQATPAEEEPQPVPARDRLAFEQAERVKTAPLPTKSRKAATAAPSPQPPSSNSSDRMATAKPWIIVGIVTVVALIASIIVMNVVRADDTPAPTAASTSETATAAPTTSAKPSTTTTEKKQTETKKPADEAPTVDVGTTGAMDIPTWGITAQISGKFGWPRYEIQGEQLMLLESPLINQLPDTCADMRTQWGIQKTAAGAYEVLKPESSCAAAPELYDEIWGLTSAMVETIQPM